MWGYPNMSVSVYRTLQFSYYRAAAMDARAGVSADGQQEKSQDEKEGDNHSDEASRAMAWVDGDDPVAAMWALLGVLVYGLATRGAGEHVVLGIALVFNPFLVGAVVIFHRDHFRVLFS